MQSTQEFEETTNEEERYLDFLWRTQVDFVNDKYRLERDRAEQAKLAKVDLVPKLLTVLDDLNRAQETMPAKIARSNWAKGIKLIEKKLMAILEEEGISKIEAEGRL